MRIDSEKFQRNKAKIKRKLFGFNLTDGLLYRICVYVLLIAVSYVFLYPLLKMVSMALMSKGDIINPEVQWVPTSLSFENLKIAIKVLDIPTTLINSMWLSTLLALSQTVVSALTGYAFSQFEFKFKNFWFGMVLASFIIPVPIVLIPRIMMFTSLQDMTSIKMIGSVIPQLSMSLLGQGVYSAILILIFYNFFKLVPKVLDEAARIDGANAWHVFWHIFIKMSASTIFTVFLFAFVWNWNETYVTSTFVRSSVQLLPMKLGAFDSLFESVAGSMPSEGGGAKLNEAYKMAGTLLSMLPLLIMYGFVQKRFVEGIENTGITGE